MPQKPVGGLASELRIDQHNRLDPARHSGGSCGPQSSAACEPGGAQDAPTLRACLRQRILSQTCEVYDLAILAASLVHPIKLSILLSPAHNRKRIPVPAGRFNPV